jgi:hypothetical protein
MDGELCGVDDAGLPSFANTQAATDGERGMHLVSYVRGQGFGRSLPPARRDGAWVRIGWSCAELGAELKTTVDQTLIRGLVTAFRIFVSGLSSL